MYAEIKFNNGNGALLCNGCSVIIAYGFDHEDRLHFCDSCTEVYSKKDEVFQNVFRKQKKVLEESVKPELHNSKICCEGGYLTAGCFHDNCAGPIEAK